MSQNPISSSDELAKAALGQANKNQPPASAAGQDEVAASDEVAETLQHLQNVIERNAKELMRLGQELKEKRESLKSVFENDPQLAEAEEKALELSQEVKERKSLVINSPQAVSLKNQIGEINQEKKEIEETLSNHLINYYSLTNSTSFDTSDGDQWDFKISARVKAKKQEE